MTGPMWSLPAEERRRAAAGFVGFAVDVAYSYGRSPRELEHVRGQALAVARSTSVQNMADVIVIATEGGAWAYSLAVVHSIDRLGKPAHPAPAGATTGQLLAELDRRTTDGNLALVDRADLELIARPGAELELAVRDRGPAVKAARARLLEALR